LRNNWELLGNKIKPKKKIFLKSPVAKKIATGEGKTVKFKKTPLFLKTFEGIYAAQMQKCIAFAVGVFAAQCVCLIGWYPGRIGIVPHGLLVVFEGGPGGAAPDRSPYRATALT
jgi:hypothetical protein